MIDLMGKRELSTELEIKQKVESNLDEIKREEFAKEIGRMP